jgi:hypothetical protein
MDRHQALADVVGVMAVCEVRGAMNAGHEVWSTAMEP